MTKGRSIITASKHPSPASSLKTYGLVLMAAVLVGGLVMFGLVKWAEERHFDRLDEISNERLNLYVSTLDAALKRFDYLPFILSRDGSIRRLLTLPSDDAVTHVVNQKLEAWRQESSAGALFVMNASGVVLASSNWRDEQSFVGRDYHFRPYFQDAMAGRPGRFFAIGYTTKQPGFFLSFPIRLGHEVAGVAVVKVDMGGLERDWAAGGENLLVTDADQVSFLSSNPDWKYRSLVPISRETQMRFRESRKYAGETIRALSFDGPTELGAGRSTLNIEPAAPGIGSARGFYLRSRDLRTNGWTLHYLTELTELAPVRRDSRLIGILVMFLLAAIGVLIVQRRLNTAERERAHQLSMDKLEDRVRERTRELNASNQRLREENAERIKAEAELRRTQEELIQAAKLAALGEMSAGIVHEINQPLSAMQTFLASTRLLLKRNQSDAVAGNLDDIEDMVKRMSTIVSHLKGFASKSKGTLTPVAIDAVVDNALLLMRPRLKSAGVSVEWERPPQPVLVSGDEIRLEQILINLFRNAADAMQDQKAERVLRIAAEVTEERIALVISDTGPGIRPGSLPKVFDPFFTTKEVGEGMGLGLSVSYGIAREMGGDLMAANGRHGGAVFRLMLNAADQRLVGAL